MKLEVGTRCCEEADDPSPGRAGVERRAPTLSRGMREAFVSSLHQRCDSRLP